MKTTEDLKRYPIASDTYDVRPLFQECLVKVGEKWFMEIRCEKDLSIIELDLGEVFAWLDSSKHSPEFKRSIFADHYFSPNWELERI
jgi:hypothetical protein